jgi:alkanesulfonate monooxygenase SsuD/methylene tetrahydromethanopterin reductase-like flavin-dependent oxidoreductase (luciferase family)
MDVGMFLLFQNAHPGLSDDDFYRQEIRLAERAEPLGFDSLWSVEHHFFDYALCPDNLQFLSYMASRTRTLKLGTGAVILPWNQPIRVAEKVAMLDNLSGGRVLFGMGRGLARREYEGFGVDMGEARGRFDEAARMIVAALEQGSMEGNGPHYPQARRELRPRPARSFRGRTYAVAMSADSVPICAEIGARMMFFSQLPIEKHVGAVDVYRGLYRQHHGVDAPPPVTVDFVYCDRDAGRAEEMARRHIGAYQVAVSAHYELAGEHFAEKKGYESYAGTAAIMRKVKQEKIIEGFVQCQTWGTPQQILDRLERRRRALGDFDLRATFSYSGMPYADVASSVELFAREVLPELRGLASADPPRTAAARA